MVKSLKKKKIDKLTSKLFINNLDTEGYIFFKVSSHSGFSLFIFRSRMKIQKIQSRMHELFIVIMQLSLTKTATFLLFKIK